jgi:hypothetical protein
MVVHPVIVYVWFSSMCGYLQRDGWSNRKKVRGRAVLDRVVAHSHGPWGKRHSLEPRVHPSSFPCQSRNLSLSASMPLLSSKSWFSLASTSQSLPSPLSLSFHAAAMALPLGGSALPISSGGGSPRSTALLQRRRGLPLGDGMRFIFLSMRRHGPLPLRHAVVLQESSTRLMQATPTSTSGQWWSWPSLGARLRRCSQTLYRQRRSSKAWLARCVG